MTRGVLWGDCIPLLWKWGRNMSAWFYFLCSCAAVLIISIQTITSEQQICKQDHDKMWRGERRPQSHENTDILQTLQELGSELFWPKNKFTSLKPARVPIAWQHSDQLVWTQCLREAAKTYYQCIPNEEHVHPSPCEEDSTWGRVSRIRRRTMDPLSQAGGTVSPTQALLWLHNQGHNRGNHLSSWRMSQQPGLGNCCLCQRPW